jgi:RHS repeat-associated protein
MHSVFSVLGSTGLAASLLLTSPVIGQSLPYNPLPDDTSTYHTSPEEPCCPDTCMPTDDGAGDGAASTCRPCDEVNSVFFSMSLGLTGFHRRQNFFVAAVAPTFSAPRATPPVNPIAPSGMAHKVRNFKELASTYRRSPISARRNFRLWLSQEDITANTYLPSALIVDSEATAQKIYATDGVTIRQVLTDDRLADIQSLATVRTTLPSDIQSALPSNSEGYVLRTWFAWEKGTLSGGLYTLPTASPLAYIVFYNPDAPTASGRFNIIHRTKFNGSSYKTLTYTYHQDATSHDWTANLVSGLPTGTILRQTELDVISWTSTKDFTRIRTVKHAELQPDGTLGSLKTVSVTRENFDDIGGTSRLVEEIAGFGSAYQRTTRYGYFSDTADNATLGRLKWRSDPDGSFVYYQYSFDFVGDYATEIEYRPWKGYKWNPDTETSGPNPANCVVVTSSITSTGVTVQTTAAGQTIAYYTEEWSTATDGTAIFTRKDWYDGSNFLTTTTGYHSATDGHQANRIKWRELPDGTAEEYSYSNSAIPNNTPDNTALYQQIVETGAGDRNGVTAGTRVVSNRNRHGLTIEEHTYHFHGTTSLELSNWVAESTTIDFFGRPTKRIHNANTADYDQTLYGCCGVASVRNRQGILTEYFRDDLLRVHKTVTTAGTRIVTTETHFNGLETTVRRKSSSLDLLVSKTWARTNGEIEKSHAPDENNDANPEETTYAYTYPSTGGRIVTITHPDTSQEVTETFTDGRTKSVTGTAVPDSSYDYGTHNLNGGGLTTTVTRPSTASPTGEWVKSYTDRYGRTFRNEYPTQLRTPGTLDKAETTFFAASDSAGSRGKPYQSIDPDGVTATYAYDSEGERQSVTEVMPGSVGNRVTATSHDAVNDADLGSVASMRHTTTLNGVTTSVTLQAGSGLASKSISFGRITTTIRTPGNAGAWTETTTQPDNTRIRQVYSKGLLHATERRDNTTGDEGRGNLISSVSYTYDDLGRMLSSDDSRTDLTNYTSYTESGNLLSETDPGTRTTTYAYDKMGRRTLVNQPDTAIQGGTAANETRTSYHLSGNVKAVWGDQTNATFHLYDEQNRMTELRTYRSLAHNTEPTSATTGYDATTWTYHTQRGWLTYKEYPDGQDAGTVRDPGPSYTYTAAGRLKTRTLGGGKRTRYDYRQGFLVARRHFLTAAADDGTNAGNDPQTPDVGYSHTVRGELQNVISSSTAAQPGSRQLYHYDTTTFRVFRELQQMGPGITFTLTPASTGILISITSTSITRWLHHKADSILRNTGAHLRQSLSPTFGTPHIDSTITYGSTDGRLLSVTGDFIGTAGTYTYTYAYQTSSNSDLIDTVTGPVHTVDNQWESTRDALDWKENKVGSATVSKYDYSVNAIGQRDSVAATSTVGTFANAPDWNWLYNARGELVSSQHVNTTASSRHYTFDGIGNRSEHREGTHTSTGGTAKAYTPNALNQYDAVGSLNPVYDLDGNMTTGPLPVAPTANSSLTWDGNNQLIEVTPSGGSAIKYHYDALGRRVARTIGSTRTYWFYDGWNPVAEFSGAVHTTGSAPAVTLEKTHLWGTDLSGSLQGAGGVGGLLATNLETGASAGVYHPLFDGNGNIGQYLNSSGTAVAKYEYDGFGNSLVSTGSLAADFPHRFSTKPLDPETGLYYYTYRWYDPLTGRWPSRDPIGERGGLNLYGFVGNDGVNKLDVLGLAEPATHKVGKCEVYIYYGHSANGHKWKFKDVACGLQSFIGCFPDKNNLPDPGMRATGTPYHEHLMAIMNGGHQAGINSRDEQNLITGYDAENDPMLQGAMPDALDEVTSPKSIQSSVDRLCKCTCSCTNVKATLEIQNDNDILDGLKHSKRWAGKFKNKGFNVLTVTKDFTCGGTEADYQLDNGTYD